MPRALNGRSVLRQMRSTTACYFLHADGARQQPDGETTWMVVPWRVAACGAGAHMNREAHAHRCQPTPSKNPNPNPNPGVDDRDVYASVLTRGCAALPRQSCPATKSYEATLARWRGVWPSGWVHCEHTISPQPRQMKNLAAFTAGALAYHGQSTRRSSSVDLFGQGTGTAGGLFGPLRADPTIEATQLLVPAYTMPTPCVSDYSPRPKAKDSPPAETPPGVQIVPASSKSPPEPPRSLPA